MARSRKPIKSFYRNTRAQSVDPDGTKARSFHIPYSNSENSPVLPGYLLGNIDDGVIQQYLPGVKNLWSKALTLEQFPIIHASTK